MGIFRKKKSEEDELREFRERFKLAPDENLTISIGTVCGQEVVLKNQAVERYLQLPANKRSRFKDAMLHSIFQTLHSQKETE